MMESYCLPDKEILSVPFYNDIFYCLVSETWRCNMIETFAYFLF